jgi:hypothetical protein
MIGHTKLNAKQRLNAFGEVNKGANHQGGLLLQWRQSDSNSFNDLSMVGTGRLGPNLPIQFDGLAHYGRFK